MRQTPRFLATTSVLFVVPFVAASFATEDVPSPPRSVQTPLQLAPFSAIELNSGHVILRPAATHRVTLVKGSLDYTRVAVTSAGVLRIDKCRVKCPRGYELEVEVQTPSVRRLVMMNGGWIQSLGSFARQPDLAARVNHGGTIDARALAADRVNAEVEQGGRILTVPRGSLFATVTQGGAITYWGNPRVQESVQHGGVVSRGEASEINVPLAELGFPVMSVPHPPRPPHRRK